MSAKAEKKLPKLLPESLITPTQHKAIDRLFNHDHTLLAVPMGFGKTMVALTAINELQKSQHVGRVLVVAPARVRDLTWAQEHQRWEHLQEMDVSLFPNASGDVVVTSFNQLGDALACGAVFDGLVVDELTKVKTAGGAWFKQLRKWIPSFSWRVGMTGSLADEGLEHLYAMAMVVDGGKALGKRKDMFLDRFFVATDYNRYNWEPRPGAGDRIAALIRSFTFRVDTDDQARPPLDKRTLSVFMGDDGWKVYRQMASDMVVEIGDDEIIAGNAAVMMGKLQQICSGFIYTEEHGDIAVHDDKMAMVRKVIGQARGPIMVVYQYKAELARLRSQYPDAPVLGDGVSRDAAVDIETRWNAREIPVLLVHPLSAGHGLNFQYGGADMVFCGPIWSRDQTEQLIARLWRRGQRDEVRVTVLATHDTLEEKVIIPRVEGKGDDAAAFMDHLDNVVG